MVAGETDATVEPENSRAHAGVTCTTCHSISGATMDGNGSYTLRTSEVPVPAGDSPEAEGIEAHRERLRSLKERSNRACASCHRGFLSQATGHEVLIDGFNEVTPWRRSGWAGNPATRIDREVPERDCVGCHMPKTEDGHRSHRFPGGHTTFAAMLDADEQLKAVRELLSDAATIDVAALGLGEERTPVGYERGPFRIGGQASRDWQVKPGDRVWFDVVVRNVAGGHRFPGGQRDLRDTWIAASVETAGGRRIAEAGVDHAETGDDPTAHRLRAELLNPRAGRERTHSVAHFRAPAYDNTIPPRSSAVVRYAFRLPESLPTDAFPLQIRAELNHRRLIRSFMNEACEAAGTERAAAFLEQTKRQLGRSVEPCVEQPTTEIASDAAELFQERFDPGDNKSPFARWFDRSLGLQHHLSQRLDEAIESLERADQVIDGNVQITGPTEETESQRRMRAMVDFVRGQIFARQRRHEAAIAAFGEAQDNVGDHPAIFRGRGNAYANVWKYEEAADAFARGAEMIDDDRLHRRHAIALGSLGRYGGSLLAAQRGLTLEPRDTDLLRAQYLATRNLDVPQRWRTTAKRAYHRYQQDDRAAQLRAECSDESERCRRERLPVHTHEMEVD